jgi:DNA-binding XRE family transcriptional regulator
VPTKVSEPRKYRFANRLFLGRKRKDVYLGKINLRRLRQECGMTQVEVGELLGVDESVVSRTERKDPKTLRLSTILKWAEALGLVLDVDTGEEKK